MGRRISRIGPFPFVLPEGEKELEASMLKSWWKQKHIEVYITAVIIPSIILSIFALLTLIRHYYIVNYIMKSRQMLPLPEDNWLGSFNLVSIFAFAMVIFSLILILFIGSYLSTHNMQRQLEVTQLKNDFISAVSHELKTPLTSIRLLAERLVKLAPEDREKQKEYHNLILKQSYRLSHLIENILDFSKLEEDKQRYKFEKTDLAELIGKSIEDYPVKLIKPEVKLEINLSADLPMFYLDKEAVSRAFTNLLDNALKFSPEQGIIKINLSKIKEEAVIEVEDQGQGIEDKYKQNIFKRFYHTGKGTGLGLALARHIAEGHNGRIEFESQTGKGSKFKIVLPCKDQP